MGSPFLAEIKMASFNIVPKDWALCNGQLLPINQNQALFALLGTTYGGDGRTTFGLPNLQGRVPMHMGSGHTLGERGGEVSHTLLLPEIPTHTHSLNATSSTSGQTPVPTNALLSPVASMYTSPNDLTTLTPQSITTTGGTQPHNNMQPYRTISFLICLIGIFPSQT